MMAGSDDDDFGEPEFAEETVRIEPPQAEIIPFGRQKENPAVLEAWKREIAAASKNRKPLRFDSPLEALDELERKRKLPTLPQPPQWHDFARRASIYPGEMMAVAGPTGGGKTSFAIQLARVAIGIGTPVLWLPLELDSSQLNLRIAANIHGTHMYKIRDHWKRRDIERVLIQVSDKWRYVEKVRGIEEQIEALRIGIRLARKIYRRPPLYVIDYVGKLARGSRDARAELADAIETLRQMTLDEECYGMLLSQTSRGNNALLSGKVDLDSAADAIGVSAETAELEHAVAVNVALNVFKADDAPVLDAHVLVSKARNTGREGRVGFQFTKAGGRWMQLEHLPPTPGEVGREVAAQKKNKAIAEPADAPKARRDMNAERESDSKATRQRAIVAMLSRAGLDGLGTRTLRNAQGCNNSKLFAEAADELLRRGIIEHAGNGRFRAIFGIRES